ncbi:hypothetical protein BGZ79_002021 [Entomortierella chlamydospora]|nr:hypothetical protein BGZ79_002021 [Entomortierella chlamydospora]
MSDLSAVYKELVASNDSDTVVKDKDGKQLKIISFLIKKRSSVFKIMLESSMKEVATGVIDPSSQYSLEAFRGFMAYIYYNKLYTGSYVPLSFEILCIADYYNVDSYRSYISDRIIKLITDVPICLIIASEALKHGTLTSKIYTWCLEFLMEAFKLQECVCYDEYSGDPKPWCCSDYSTKNKGDHNYGQKQYIVDEHVACIYSTFRRKQGYYNDDQFEEFKERSCIHGSIKPVHMDISQLPDFVMDNVNKNKSNLSCCYF